MARSTRWGLTVDAGAPASTWRECVELLYAVMRVVSAQVEKEYGAPLVYQTARFPPEEWGDPAILTADIAARQLRDDEGTLIPDEGTDSTHEAFLVGEPLDPGHSFLINHWYADPFRRPNLSCAMDFIPDGSSARPLTDHSVEWLVDLLRAVVAACDGEVAWIDVRQLADLQIEEEMARGLGVVSYLPQPVDTSALSSAFSTYEGPGGRGQILVADPQIATTRPEDLMDDFRILDTLYSALHTPA